MIRSMGTGLAKIRAWPVPAEASAPSRADSGWYLFATMVLVVGLLWVYIAVRAKTLAFTADESISYSILHGQTHFVETANNQWLNTWLMRVTQALLGQQPWEFRIPNVLSFGIYASAWLLVIRQLRSTAARALCFLVCFADPLLIEFFALARGYGLSLALAAGALACVVLGRSGPASHAVIRLALFAVFGGLAFYANFSALNLVLALLAVTLIDIAVAHRRGTLRIGRRELVALAAITVSFVGALLPGIIHLHSLQAAGQLYYGGSAGFITNTIGTLVQTWGYAYQYFSGVIPLFGWARAIAWVVAFAAVALVLFAGARRLRSRNWGGLQLMALTLTMMVLLVLGERLIGGSLYPIDRAALVFVLAFGALVGFAADEVVLLAARARRRAVIGAAAGILAVLATVNFARSANTTSALTWSFDAPALDLVEHLAAIEARFRPEGRQLSLVAPVPRNWALIYYYQIRYNLPWLQVIPGPDSTPGADLYEVPPWDVATTVPGTKLVAVLRAGTQLRAGPGFNVP